MRLRPGTPVIITVGHFAGRDGIVQEIHAPDVRERRIDVQLEGDPERVLCFAPDELTTREA